MAQKNVWGIKLGSGGRCVPFCEKHRIVGVGWKDVDKHAIGNDDWDKIWEHLRGLPTYAKIEDKTISNWTGSLYRFGIQCKRGDYVLYYDPERKLVQITVVNSEPMYRDFDQQARDTVGEEVDIWHYREVDYPIAPIPLLDFYGALKGRLLGPRIAFWEIAGVVEIVDCLCAGVAPNVSLASDPEIRTAYDALRSLILRRAEALNERDWELVVADFLRAQGAQVDERQIGGSHAVMDVEARFNLGVFGESVWRAQVKRLQNRQVDALDIDYLAKHGGDAQLCFVSVFGFTTAASRKAEQEGIMLLEAGDFVQFFLAGKLRDSIAQKLRLPVSSKSIHS